MGGRPRCPAQWMSPSIWSPEASFGLWSGSGRLHSKVRPRSFRGCGGRWKAGGYTCAVGSQAGGLPIQVTRAASFHTILLRGRVELLDLGNKNRGHLEFPINKFFTTSHATFLAALGRGTWQSQSGKGAKCGRSLPIFKMRKYWRKLVQTLTWYRDLLLASGWSVPGWRARHPL